MLHVYSSRPGLHGKHLSPRGILASPTVVGRLLVLQPGRSVLPIVLLRNNVSSGNGTRHRHLPRVRLHLSTWSDRSRHRPSLVQLPLLGRKWSLVVSAALQGLSMAMYTQVKSTAGYVGLNALEYIMQTVSFAPGIEQAHSELTTHSTSTRCCTHPRLRCSTQHIVRARAVMLSCLGRLAGIVALFAGQKFWLKAQPVFSGSAPVVSGSRLS